MPRWLMFLIFFSVAVLILGGVHFYFYRRLVVATALPAPWRTVAKVALIALAVSFPLSFFITRGVDPAVARYLLLPVFVWLGVMLLLFFVLLGLDVLRGLGWLGLRVTGQQDLIADPGRRLLLARALAGGAAATAGIAGGVALLRGVALPVAKRLEVTLPKLPRAMDGLTIAQLTDLHLGPMRRGRWVREVVRRTNALKPDIIAITGDLADATPEQLAAETEMLGQLEAPNGIFFVTGNHEYFIDLHGWLARLRQLGVRVLRNERVTLRKGRAVLELAGIDDHEGARLAPGHGPDLARARRGHDPARPVVLLAHQPRAVKQACQHGVGLVLSGHTHGGQIWPWNYLVYLQQPYVSGLHDHQGTQIYVSPGTGLWGPPMRLGSRSEITLVTLRAPATRG